MSVSSGTCSEALDLFLDQIKSSEQGAADWIGGAGSATVPFFGENPLYTALGDPFANDAAAHFEWSNIAEGVSGSSLLVGESTIEPPCNIPLPEIDSPIIETSLPVPDTLSLEPACSMPTPIDCQPIFELVFPAAERYGADCLTLLHNRIVPGTGDVLAPFGDGVGDARQSLLVPKADAAENLIPQWGIAYRGMGL